MSVIRDVKTQDIGNVPNKNIASEVLLSYLSCDLFLNRIEPPSRATKT